MARASNPGAVAASSARFRATSGLQCVFASVFSRGTVGAVQVRFFQMVEVNEYSAANAETSDLFGKQRSDTSASNDGHTNAAETLLTTISPEFDCTILGDGTSVSPGPSGPCAENAVASHPIEVGPVPELLARCHSEDSARRSLQFGLGTILAGTRRRENSTPARRFPDADETQ